MQGRRTAEASGDSTLIAYKRNRRQKQADKKQFGENSKIRVTDIDSYRTCHRKFFIEKILRLEPAGNKRI